MKTFITSFTLLTLLSIQLNAQEKKNFRLDKNVTCFNIKAPEIPSLKNKNTQFSDTGKNYFPLDKPKQSTESLNNNKNTKEMPCLKPEGNFELQVAKPENKDNSHILVKKL